MSRLSLERESGGLRYYIRGVPLHAGDLISVRFPGGVWVPGRYEYTLRDDVLLPFFHFGLPGADGSEERDAVIRLPDGADVELVTGARYHP